MSDAEQLNGRAWWLSFIAARMRAGNTWKEDPDVLDEMATHIEELEAALSGLLSEVTGIMNESRGVDGWHLNGDVAPWSEFEDDAFGDAIETARIALEGGEKK